MNDKNSLNNSASNKNVSQQQQYPQDIQALNNSNEQYWSYGNVNSFDNNYQNQNAVYGYDSTQQTPTIPNQDYFNNQMVSDSYQAQQPQQQVVNSTNNSNQQVVKKSSESDKDSSKWIYPKNFKKLSASELSSLTAQQKKEYDTIKNSARKIGYVIEKRSLMKFYRVSLWDFFPLFIGLFISFVKFVIGYGDIIRSINFDKKSVWDFRSNFIIGMVFSLVVWPIILICVLILYPYMVMDSSTVTYAWNHLVDQLNINGAQGFGTGLQAYIQGAIVPLFHGDLLIATIIVFIILSMLNVQTFLFQGLLNINRKAVFKIQRESVRDEIEKIRVQKNK